MFDIDLLNKTGIQKNISRIKIKDKSRKQKIIFEDSSIGEIKLKSNESNESDEKLESDSFAAFLIMAFLVAGLIFISSFDFDRLINSSVFFTNNTEEKVLTDIIRLLNNSDNFISIEDITLDNSLNFSLMMNDLDQIKLMNRESLNYSYKIYEYEQDQFRVLFSYPLNKLDLDKNPNQQLSTIIMRYENDYNVDAQMYGESILFKSDSRTILKILEELIYTGFIRIWPDGNGRFSLEYTS
tara:strand:- start:621 stop:1340 length:720 start_codon:yes stop_codon:yes gene_type:complete